MGPVFTGEGRPTALLNGPPTAPRARVAGGIRGGAVLEPGSEMAVGLPGMGPPACLAGLMPGM